MILALLFLLTGSNLQAQTLSPGAKTVTNPSIVADYIFKNIKTKLSAAEKMEFADGFIIKYGDNDDTTLLCDFIGDGSDFERVHLEIFPTDLNKDGVEEIFTRANSLFFGQWLQPLTMYIKGKDGKYVEQNFLSEDDTSPRLFARATGYGGYPDLIGSIPEGPGFYKQPTKFNVYRWDGTKYKIYKHNQPYLKTDESIEFDVSPAYQASLPDSLLKNNKSFDETETNSSYNTKPVSEPISSANVTTTSESKEPPKIEKPVTLSPVAESLFRNVKTKLTLEQKNEIAYLTGIKPEEIDAKTKKGKQKFELNIYPVDFDNNGFEEIFLCVGTKLLGIPMHTYFFYATDYYGKFQPSPGKIGQGVKILLNGKTGFPDLITGTPGLEREIWTWHGHAYDLIQKIPGATVIPYQTMNIDEASKKYTGQ